MNPVILLISNGIFLAILLGMLLIIMKTASEPKKSTKKVGEDIKKIKNQIMS